MGIGIVGSESLWCPQGDDLYFELIGLAQQSGKLLFEGMVNRRAGSDRAGQVTISERLVKW